jgi:hypothetical protein
MIFRLLCAALLFSAFSTTASAQYLSKDELTRLMSGTSIETTTNRGNSRSITFGADGSLEGWREIDNGRKITEYGKWWTEVLPGGSARFCYLHDWWAEKKTRPNGTPLPKKICRFFKNKIDGRNITRVRGSGRTLQKKWIIAEPGPQASAVMTAKSGARIAATPPPAPQPRAALQYLTKDELKGLMAGTSIEGVTRKGYPLYITFNANGSLDVKVESFRELSDEGKWWTKVLSDGSALFCHQYNELSKRQKICRLSAIHMDGRTIVRHLPNRRQGKNSNWVIAKPGPQARAVMAAREGARVAGRSRTPAAPPVQQPLTAARDSRPPVIDVPATIAANGAVVAIRGRIRDTSRLIEVTIDGRPVAVGADGSFRTRRGVPRGASTITIAALDEWGNRAERNVTVTREKLATRTPPSVKPGVTANPKATEKQRPNPFAGIHFGNYYALVIGNNRYRHLQSLKSARNDADAVTRLLTDDYGFKVSKLTDATRSDILGALAKYRATLKPNDNLLIYYAGHGVVDNVTEQGYWLPVDAEEQNPANWISNPDLTSMLRAIRARHVMVVADSCYSGTLVRSASANLRTAREKLKWVKRMLTKRGRTALVSGGLEPVTDSGGDNHSVFANAFLSVLRENREVLEGQALFDRIKRPVVLNADQTPRYSDIRRAGHEGGEFMFVRRTNR